MLKYTVQTTFILLMLVACQQTEHPAGRPNVLLIMVDDLNDWTAYLGGHPQAKTPNIDVLANRGMAFTNAHSNSPLCGPSRSSMLTGLRPSTSGVYFHIQDKSLVNQVRNGDLKAKLLPDYFAKNGYKTMGVGKVFHLGDQARVFNQYGGYCDFDPRPEEHFVYDPVWFDKPPGTSTDWGAYPAHDSLTFDQQIADWTMARLEEQHDKPFFMVTGFMRPHVPWYVPQKWLDAFNSDSIQTPAYLPEDWKDVPEIGKKITEWPAMPDMDWMLEESRWEDAVKAYLASMYFVDYQIGRVLKKLESSPYAENTIVVLVSDHGYHLGEKGLFQKGTLWERSSHIPMIWAGRGIKSAKTDEPVSLLDVYPTLAKICELIPPDHLEGNSLLPLLQGEKSGRDYSVVTTYGPNNHSVFYENWHYIRYNDGSEELYDLKEDEHEWVNLLSDNKKHSSVDQLVQLLPNVNEPNHVHSHNSAVPYFTNE
ncbi:sulfatase [Fulvivirga sp. M361]|uniref:sulfatase n=1 Tax=Fulvivirga sp. M361 TaxID=2594266 RepID=UPI00117B1EBD|nr:sulfatase [Fulvivirga sp. M361]TRX49040.1 sulfatase [Fulvivirga sp. M361]